MSDPIKQASPEAGVEVTVRGSTPGTGGVSRREAIQWVLAAVAAGTLPTGARDAFGAPVGRTPTPQESALKSPTSHPAEGYGVDPNLLKDYKPGDLWPLSFSAEQKKSAAALADVILPADQFGPAASGLGVPAMVDEWISAPYDRQRGDRSIVLKGLDWLAEESKKRFNKPFDELSEAQKKAICDDIHFAGDAKPEFRKGAHFFSKFRSICAGAYYASPTGWQAIGYVGNVQLARFDGPPEVVLKKLGVTQTVKNADDYDYGVE